VLLVLNKPPGLVVHPAVGNRTGTLVNALLFKDPRLQNVERAGIVHRLDKDTSGVMVVAKSDAAMSELQRQFKARETEKEYLALVKGHPPAEGCIGTKIGRHPVHRQRMAVVQAGGREAVTRFETVETLCGTALLRIRIETGRTHQIRVHCSHIGHPVVGDPVYGRSRINGWTVKPPRQLLHARRLAFVHPVSGKKLSFEAPMPDDMEQILKCLREGRTP
jgi:23S rRNA pseudouridine1911/1915/1917 synthase